MLVLKVWSHRSSVASDSVANLAMPALMKTASRRTPAAVSVSASAAAAPGAPAMFWTARALGPSVARVFSSAAPSRPVMMTRAPSAAKAAAAARPMPLVPPVTRTVFCSKRFMMVPFGVGLHM
ncbi:hypothetical protein D3C72_1687780 [compost metagenome]